MKDKYLGHSNMRGFSIIEVLIAMTVMTLAITSAVLVSGGAQLSLEGGEQNAGALSKAQALIEEIQSLARQDINLVHAIATTSDGIYTTSVSVSPWTGVSYDAELVVATVAWQARDGLERSVSLSSVITDFVHGQGSVCAMASAQEWRSPHIITYQLSTTNLAFVPPFGHTISVANPIASLASNYGLLFVGVASTSAKKNDDLFVFDVSDTTRAPRYITSIDNNAASIDGIAGVARSGKYIFIASARDPNFKKCKPSANCAQMQIIDISNLSALSSPINFLLSTSSPPYVIGNTTSSGQAMGNALTVHGGYAYLGLTKTASGPEFHILDVHDPLHPVWIGGFAVGATINQIRVHDGYAYLATDNKLREIIVLDVRDPSNPQLATTFDPIGTNGFEYGESIVTFGDTIFAGMSYALGSPEIYALDASQPSTLATLSSRTATSTVIDLLARGNTLFALASGARQLQIFDIADVSKPVLVSTSTTQGSGTALACSGNTLIIGSNMNGQGYISFVSP